MHRRIKGGVRTDRPKGCDDVWRQANSQRAGQARGQHSQTYLMSSRLLRCLVELAVHAGSIRLPNGETSVSEERDLSLRRREGVRCGTCQQGPPIGLIVETRSDGTWACRGQERTKRKRTSRQNAHTWTTFLQHGRSHHGNQKAQRRQR
jgi:hypothetical protein